MDLYSTALWHLKRESKLSYLAQDLLSINRQSPIAWCVAGNAFSLQKEHENALKSFERALQLNPDYTYAHNLCGHEHHANEAFDKALLHFRNAIRSNPRLYNAW
jgi:anaphase-promoting complex subunit 3